MLEWFNENENRNYPIREDHPAISTAGIRLPTGILADLSVAADSAVAGGLYISSVTLTPNLVSVVVATASGGALIATIADVKVHQVYRLEPVQTNVSGFVAFGPRAVIPSGREIYEFSGPEQTALSYKAVRVAETPPVTSIARHGEDKDPLTGIVRLQAGPGVNISHDFGGAVISLEERFHLEFVGPCDRSILYLSCGRPPLRTINGVGPDPGGAVTIEVQ